jgi:hypothetical protein
MVTYFSQPSYDRTLVEVILIFGRYFYRERSKDSFDIRRMHRYLQGGGEKSSAISEKVHVDE